jgi:hypothetical protein
MPILHHIFASAVAFALLTAPVLAKNPDTRQAEDVSAPSSCHSLEKAADGNWVPIPCQELGTPAPAAQRKVPDRNTQHASH